MLELFSQEIRFAARSFRATPGFFALAVVVLAMGVAAVAVQTAIVRGMRWGALPVADAERVHAVHWRDPERQPAGPFFGLPLNDLPAWQDAQRSFGETTAFGSGWAAIVQSGAQARRFTGCYVQGNFFAFLGARPLLGRAIEPADNQPGAAPNVVLGHRMWQTEFGGRNDVVGDTFPLNGKIATVVGVMGPEFAFPMGEDLWIPLYTQYAPREQGNAYSPFVRTLGRLAPDVPVTRALAELEAHARETARKFPTSNARLTGAVIEPLRETFLAPAVSRLVWLMLAAVFVVMALACGNVVNMLLVRAGARQHDQAVRVALGASSCALLRQALAEATVLAAAAIAVGNVLALAIVPLVWRWVQSTEFRLPQWMAFTIDGRVLAIASAISAACLFLAAAAPGAVLQRLGMATALRAGGRAASSGSAGRIASAFVIVQVALTVVLLAWTSLIVRSVHNQLAAEWGYPLDSVLSGRVGLFPSSYATIDARAAVTEKLLRELRAAPGVEAAAITDRFRMTLVNSFGVQPPEAADANEAAWPQVWVEAVSDGYFSTLRIPLRQGREFLADEQWSDRASVMVNESFVRRFFSGGAALGRTVRLQGHPPRTVVGVVPDTLMEGPGNAAADGAGVFVPWRSSVTAAGTLFPTFVLRGGGRPELLERPLRAAVARVDSGLAVYYVGTPAALVVEYLAAGRVMAGVLTGLAGVALLLAATGIFGLVSAGVTQRLREFAVRLALGARGRSIVGVVLVRNAREVAIGLALGLAGAFGSVALLAPRLDGVLYRVSPFEVGNYVLVAFVLVATSLVACLAPLRRALRVQPVELLRGP